MVAVIPIVAAIPWSIFGKDAAIMLGIIGVFVFMVLYVLEKNNINILKAANQMVGDARFRNGLLTTNDIERIPRSISSKMSSSGYDPSKGLSKFASLPGFTATNPFERFDIIYYINLDHRKDRLHEITQECVRMGIPKHKLHRIPGVKEKLGTLGCSKAHLNALLHAKENGYQTFIVLEDDFMFKYNKEFTWEQLNRFWTTNIQWDLVMLSSNTLKWANTSFDFLIKVQEAQTTGGYMVNRPFLDELIQNVRDGVTKLEAQNNYEYCIDQHWKLLQRPYKWFVFNPIIGHQRDSFSDIEKVVTEYPDKRELVEEMPTAEFLVLVQTCHIRTGKFNDLLASLENVSKVAPICFYQYKGDPNLSTDYSVDELNRIILLRCKDDYLNLCHKYGQLLHALQILISTNKCFRKLRGVLFLDDDVSIVGNLYEFLNKNADKDYYGFVTSMDAPTTNFLKRKAKESRVVNEQMQAFPGLKKYDMQIHMGKYCAGPAYCIKPDLISLLAHSNDLFLPFPETQTVLDNYLVTTADGQGFYSNEVSVMQDSNIGACLSRAGIVPTHVEMKQVIDWV